MEHAATLAKPDLRQPVHLKVPAFLAAAGEASLKAMGEALLDKCTRSSHAKGKPPQPQGRKRTQVDAIGQ